MTDTADLPVAPAPSRVEDRRLLCGEGRYLANLPLPPGTLHAGIVRSEHAHGELRSVGWLDGQAPPGAWLISGADLLDVLDPLPSLLGTGPDYRPIAVERVRYVGEPVAVVLAESPEALGDAIADVVVDIDPLPHVRGPIEALAPNSPLIDISAPGNVAWERTYTYGDPDQAFAACDRIVRARVQFPRYNSTPLETYGVIASWSNATRAYDVIANFQGPFSLLPVVARALKIRDHQLRLRVPEDVGGSFGIKAMVYPYVSLIAACSRHIGRPVRWIEQRSEHLIASTSGTERWTDVEVAVDNDGIISAIRTDIVEDVGAYLRAPEPSCVMRSLTLFSGPYRIDHGQTRARVVLTNRMPTGLNRGYGGQQHTFTIERVVDAVADELGIDPLELRLRNLVRPEEFPRRSASGTLFDSGDYAVCLRRAAELVGYEELRREQQRRRRDGDELQLGIGMVSMVHSSAANIGYVTLALDPSERSAPGYQEKSGALDRAEVALTPSGRVRVRVASAVAGQGHATTAGQIAAGILGVALDAVDVVDQVDTADAMWGTTTGSYSSRFTVMVGGAVARAATELEHRIRTIAACILEANPDDLVLRGGSVVARDAPHRNLSLRQIAGRTQWNRGSFPDGVPTDLSVTATWSPSNLAPPDSEDRINAAATYGFMADIVVVEVDTNTGEVRVVDYAAVHDVGRAINPTVITGQIHGGIAHGIAGALFEHTGYDHDNQPTGSSLLTYLCPSSAESHRVSVEHAETPSPFSHLGVKGCGENSAMSAPAAVAAAVEDALAPYGVRIRSLPITPELVWRSIHCPEEAHA